MQEEVTQRTVALCVEATKLSTGMLQQAMKKVLDEMQKGVTGHKTKLHHGKQTLRQLMKHNTGVSNIEITDQNIRAFSATAKKYGIDFALKKDTSGEIPRYLVFFKGRDADVITAAFREFSAKNLEKEKKPSILNESVLLFFIGLIAILTFGAMLLDPQKLDKEIEKMKKNAERYYQTSKDSASGDFRDFLRIYNQLEQLLVNFAEVYMNDEISQTSYNSYISNRRPQIIQILKMLSSKQIIPLSLQNELNELRMYRNALVHGVDFEVSQDVCTRISEIYNTLQQAFNTLQEFGKNSVEYRKAIEMVYNLTR